MLIANYITSAWRNILRHKLFSIINIMGLAIGLAAVMLIALYVRYETSYDSFWKNADNIYRTNMIFQAPGQTVYHSSLTTYPVIYALKNSFPQIQFASRISLEKVIFTINDDKYTEELSIADKDILNIFDFTIISGDLNSVFSKNSAIALTQSLAHKYFGMENPIGKRIFINEENINRDFVVAAIIKDLPANSQLKISSLILLDENDWQDRMQRWFNTYGQLYYTLKNGFNNEVINQELNSFVDDVFPHLPWGPAELKTTSAVNIKSLPIQKLHLYSNSEDEYNPSGNIKTVTSFVIIALFVLIIAGINFMNLSTARSSRRAKEVAIRKISGANRKKLIVQFLGEACLFSLISLLIATVIAELSLSIFNRYLESELTINYMSSDFFIVIGFALCVGLLAGCYPAFILSNFRPSQILKSTPASESASISKFRAILVIIQFAISIALFVSTATIYAQISQAMNSDLGYNKENLLTINNIYNEQTLSKLPALLYEIKNLPEVTSVSWANTAPAGSSGGNYSIRTPDMPEGQSILIGAARIGTNYFKTLGVPLIAGREYSNEYNDITLNDKTVSIDQLKSGSVPTGRLIINQSAVRRLGFKNADDAIGKIVGLDNITGDKTGIFHNHQIIGVVPDIHFESLKRELRPEFYQFDELYVGYITLRYLGNPSVILDKLKSIWQKELPGLNFDYDFAINAVADLYRQEQNELTMFAAFSGLAIFIACLGLFGLASFTAERRTKEIGIRKVFGAEVWQIVKLLVWQFSKPVLIANIIAWPIAYLAMSRWLESFVYRIDDMVIIALCLLAGLTALLIAWATVAGNSYAVARQNPIKALRYE